jgi:outer membrane protein TolC
VTLSISIPFGGGSQARSDVAQITADLVRDEQDLQRFQKTFAFIWERGLAQIQEKQRASKLAVQRSLDADSIRSALVKAAEAGEVEYLERLRAERQAFEAQIAAIEADVDYQQTVSRFLQSIGRLPNGVNSK